MVDVPPTAGIAHLGLDGAERTKQTDEHGVLAAQLCGDVHITRTEQVDEVTQTRRERSIGRSRIDVSGHSHLLGMGVLRAYAAQRASWAPSTRDAARTRCVQVAKNRDK
jgi:hypothetical protein